MSASSSSQAILTKNCIIIKKIDYDSKSKRLELLNEAIGNSLTYNAALSIIEHLYESKFITRKEFELIKISINDRTLSSAENKNIIRAEMLKGMITVILS